LVLVIDRRPVPVAAALVVAATSFELRHCGNWRVWKNKSPDIRRDGRSLGLTKILRELSG